MTGINHVTVSGLIVEHVLVFGILSVANTFEGTYFTGGYNRLIGNCLWNTAPLLPMS